MVREFCLKFGWLLMLAALPAAPQAVADVIEVELQSGAVIESHQYVSILLCDLVHRTNGITPLTQSNGYLNRTVE